MVWRVAALCAALYVSSERCDGTGRPVADAGPARFGERRALRNHGGIVDMPTPVPRSEPTASIPARMDDASWRVRPPGPAGLRTRPAHLRRDHDHDRRRHHHRQLCPHADGRVPGRPVGCHRDGTGGHRGQGGGRAVGGRSRGDRPHLYGLRPACGPRPSPCAAGGAGCGAARFGRGDDRQQDVRIGHAGRDHGL